MAVNKNIVFKNGLEVNNDLLLADSANQKVGIGTSVPSYTLHVLGGIGATEAYISGVTTLAATGGITTTGGDLYVGDDLRFDEFDARNGNITGILTAATSNVTNNFTVGGTADITGTLTAGLIDGGFY